MSHTPSPTRPPRASASANWSIRDIDAIFDKYDEDGGGYMDEDEAKCMIRGLKETGQQAERDMRQLERETPTTTTIEDICLAAYAEYTRPTCLTRPYPIGYGLR